ncbi:MAG: DUF3299 domain-containing protein, partial [Burkholderiaceae bacterium]
FNRRTIFLGLGWLSTAGLFLGVGSGTGATGAVAADAYKTITWDDLIDEQWAKAMQAEMMAIGRLGFLKDGTEAADRAMAKLRQKWDEAPVVDRFNGQKVRIPGYVVPLDASRDPKRAFLLVPYFGACIHTPPPPANQIILVQPKSDSRIKSVPESMETVWIEGLLEVGRATTSQGVTGYVLQADAVRPYTGKPGG